MARYRGWLILVVAAMACGLLGILASGELVSSSNETQLATGDLAGRSKIFDFVNFKFVFHKKYSSPIENLVRMGLYLTRCKQVFLSRVKFLCHKSRSYMAINHMSDWTRDELQLSLPDKDKLEVAKQVHRAKRESDASELKGEADEESKEELEEEIEIWDTLQPIPGAQIDHRDCMAPARDQGLCGSCSLFSTMSVFEWFYCKASGEKANFSEQFALDCGPGSCAGSSVLDLAQFCSESGLERAAIYPYFARKKPCLFEGGDARAQIGYWQVKPRELKYEKVPRDELLSKLHRGPILVTLAVNPNQFHTYGGGVDEMVDCDPDAIHAMVLVGYKNTSDEEYLLLRNSHGPDFGESGYIRVSRAAFQRCYDDHAGSGIQILGPLEFQLNGHYDSTVVDRMSPVWLERFEERMNPKPKPKKTKRKKKRHNY